MKAHEHVILEIARERERQITVEGWTIAHDDEGHDRGEMARAAACYAYASTVSDDVRALMQEDANHHRQGHTAQQMVVVGRMWPWDWSWWKPKDRRRDLVRAAALIVAEIERLDRAAAVAKSPAA